ncbi:UNVERIFIED_CONTAM: hypothetical protein OHV15_17980 [Microbacterium sp. SLM126]
MMRLHMTPCGRAMEDAYARDSDSGCSCHVSPPCGNCTHEGHPDNLAETPEAWCTGAESVRWDIAEALWHARRAAEGQPRTQVWALPADHAVWRDADAVLAALPPALLEVTTEPGVDPNREVGDRFESAMKRLTDAVAVQQPLPIPDQYALVHRRDVLTMRYELQHKRAYFKMLRRAEGLDPQLVPDRDPSKPATEQGMYQKYHVFRTDGKDAPGAPKAGAEYFVLDLTHDPYAAVAARAYAKACSVTHMELAADLVTMLPDTQGHNGCTHPGGVEETCNWCSPAPTQQPT